MTTQRSQRAQIDAVTAEIVRSGVVAITDEMKTNLMRTAYNMIIYEALDFTVGLFDAKGNTISIGLGLPMFIRGLSDTIKAKLDFFARTGIEPGDILLTNDSYIMGSHLNHMVFTVPIFWEGEIVAFASSMAHWQDVGGVLGGATRDIFSEGLQLPIVKIFKRGVQDLELTEIIKSNVRLPELAMGDFRAQVAAVKTGERRFVRLLERYGRDAVLGGVELIYEQSERLARASVATIPDGVYEAESFMDDDGVSEGQRIPIKVRVVVEGDQMTVDLTEVSRQVGGYYNSGATAGRSAAEVAFKCITSPPPPAHQSRLIRAPQRDTAARASGERDQAGCDAHVDDGPDDHRGHHHPGALLRNPGTRGGGPPRRSRDRQHLWGGSRDRALLLRPGRTAGRRVRGQTQRGRHERDGLHQ